DGGHLIQCAPARLIVDCLWTRCCAADAARFREEESMAKSTANKKKPSGTRARKVTAVRRICNVVPSKGTETDWTFQDAVASAALGAVSAPPASVDLRAAWWTIGDQEDTGSCVGWATADGVARYQMVKANKLAKNVQLSPRFV